MAKMFYTAAEAAEKLGTTEDDVKDLVKEGKLREFRDAGSVNYKVEDVDKVAASMKKSAPSSDSAVAAPPAPSDTGSGGSAGGEIVLEPAEDSGIALAAGSDVLSLEEAGSTAGGTSASTAIGAPKKKDKGDTAVPSVGVDVFDDDDLDEHVDPLAQTAVTDVAGLALEGTGSGSGIMDLTREADDTSLGQELLDEIYTDEQPAEAAAADAEDTKAGLEAAVPDTADEEQFETEGEAAPAGERAVTAAVVADDPVATSLTAIMVVSVVVLWFAGLGAAALVRGITPSLLQWLYGKLMFAAIGALVVCLIVAGVTYLIAKRSS